VLCAFGSKKAPAVRAMLRGPIDPACPASLLRQHPDAHVLLDREAAAELTAG
jgi:glucosamine-6-phosphate deaminase